MYECVGSRERGTENSSITTEKIDTILLRINKNVYETFRHYRSLDYQLNLFLKLSD
jgi:hypothetical protein